MKRRTDQELKEEKPVRIQKIISDHGIASRRAAEKMIQDGRVCVNGLRAVLGQSAKVDADLISVDGVPLGKSTGYVYLMLNKPRGYLTTVRDDRGRKTVMELIKGIDARVYPVGRLDLNSEGLLLFTNDGGFANAVMHPSSCKQKTYEVKVRGDALKALDLLRQPVKVDELIVQALNVELATSFNNGGILHISISEGRNRQIRKMCINCGVTVISLKRLSLGLLELGELKSGQWRFLTKEEVTALGKV